MFFAGKEGIRSRPQVMEQCDCAVMVAQDQMAPLTAAPHDGSHLIFDMARLALYR